MSYFIGELNLSLSGTALTTLGTVWINRYENEYLYKALGYGFARLFIDGIAAGSPAQRWLDLKNGKEYTVNDVNYKWEGFSNTILKSPIANYVYALYQKNNSSTTFGQGEGAPQMQNAQGVNASFKIHNAWADMLVMNEQLYHFLNNNTATYPEWELSEVECFGSLNPFNI
jgi:hypothetical protein